MITLVTGGVKSGKSFHALTLARETFPASRCFLATAVLMDSEMEERVARHRKERLGPDGREEFRTIEEPVDVAGALKSIYECGCDTGVLIDCLPMWVNNLMHYGLEEDFPSRLDDLLLSLPKTAILVTNETGWGNIPFDPLTRRYNRLLAETNRRVAAQADRVILMVSGIPLTVK